MHTIKHLELFSGIGGFHRAFDLLGKDLNFVPICIGFSEIDSFATKTYKANYDVSDSIEIGDIVSFAEDRMQVGSLPQFDFLTGGFPCQAFSMMGKKKGFKDQRGNVFFEILKILKIKKPKYLLLENVRNIINHDNGRTFETIVSSLKEVGYKYLYFDIFNSNNFGLAQTRNRVYIFASRSRMPSGFEFSEQIVLQAFNERESNGSIEIQHDILDVLDKKVNEKYYLSDRIKPTILADGSASFKANSTINNLVAKPLTATMVKMHRACQDNYFSDLFINSDDPYKFIKRNFSKDLLSQQAIRKLTPKEALLLQGFSSDFYEHARTVGISDHQLYKQAGNAASVNTIYAILYYLLIKTDIMQWR
jgi:DNA (cytosine-5)-methyltransferase 1